MSAALNPLNDAEIGELDDLLAAVPEPREALDVVMLDGYLAGVIAQPHPVPIDAWLPPVLDWNYGDPDGGETASVALGADAPGWHSAKHERLMALVARHHATLERQMREEGWFDPLIMEPQDDGGRPLAGAAAIGPALAPWVIGFEHALNHFPALEALRHEDIPDLLSCLRRHLPEQDEDERAETKALDQEHPLKNLDAAIEDLVGNVIELADIARADMLRVETVRRTEPKVGRNDPCPCGSGKKFKQCHGR